MAQSPAVPAAGLSVMRTSEKPAVGAPCWRNVLALSLVVNAVLVALVIGRGGSQAAAATLRVPSKIIAQSSQRGAGGNASEDAIILKNAHESISELDAESRSGSSSSSDAAEPASAGVPMRGAAASGTRPAAQLRPQQRTQLRASALRGRRGSGKAAFQVLMSASASDCMAPAMPITHAVSRAYAAKHGYRFIVSTRVREEGTNRHPVWGKINALQHFARGAQWTLFLDLDAVITNPAIPLTKFTEAHPGAELLVVQPTGPPGRGGDPMLNAGVILVKNTAWSAAFWAAVQALSQYCTFWPHEQGAMWVVITRLLAAVAARDGGTAPRLGGCKPKPGAKEMPPVKLDKILLENPGKVVVLRTQHTFNNLRGCPGPAGAPRSLLQLAPPPTAAENANVTGAAVTRPGPPPATGPRRLGWITNLPPDCMWEPGDFVAHYAPLGCPAPQVSAASFASLSALPAPHKPVIVTAAGQAHAHALQHTLLASLASAGERRRVIVFDLGMQPEAADAVAAHPAVAEVRAFKFSAHPAHIAAVPGAWKPIVIARVLEQYNVVLWLEPGATVPRLDAALVGSLPSIFARIYRDGMFSGRGEGTVGTATHPATRAHVTSHLKPGSAFPPSLLGRAQCTGGFIGVSRRHPAYARVFEPWLACVLDAACIAPAAAGSQPHPQASQGVLSALVALAGSQLEGACSDLPGQRALTGWRLTKG
jgi:hypothetical protein